MATIIAKATRSGEWWAVEFEGPAGQRFTQAKRLDQVEAMVRDICDMDGVEVDAVQVDPVVGDVEMEAVVSYREAAEAAAQAKAQASLASRAAVSRVRAEGLSVRDVAALMGVTPQRVSQLAG